MGSTTIEEETKLASVLYDSSSSQPLLSKRPPQSPSLLIEEPAPEDSDPTQYLQITYNHGTRPFKDLPFLVLFALLVLATFGFGIFSVVNSNSDYSNLSFYQYDSNSSSCVKEEPLSFPLSLSSTRTSSSVYLSFLGDSDSSGFWRALLWVLVITLILSVPICFLLLLSLKHYTKQVVCVCLPFFFVMPACFDVYWFVSCTVSSSCSDDYPLVYRITVLVVVFLVIGIMVWIIVANWHKIELTIMIIGVASDALSKSLGLFIVLPLMMLGLVVYCSPIVVFLVFARFNGKVVATESDEVYSCEWKQDSWVPAYFALGILTMLWSFTTTVEAQVYVISPVVFQKGRLGSQDGYKKLFEILLFLAIVHLKLLSDICRNAYGPSAGTVCLSGLLICDVRLVRAAVESTKEEDAPGLVSQILRYCVNIFLSAIEYVNKFTINFAAITGEAYCTSAKMTYELLKRNLLSAAFVEIVSGRLLAGITFVLSAIYAIAACAILEGVSDLGTDSYFVTALAWALLIVVLGYFVHVLENVIDTIYICYAIDRDKGEVFKPEVHEVYVHLPITRNRGPSFALTAPIV